MLQKNLNLLEIEKNGREVIKVKLPKPFALTPSTLGRFNFQYKLIQDLKLYIEVARPFNRESEFCQPFSFTHKNIKAITSKLSLIPHNN